MAVQNGTRIFDVDAPVTYTVKAGVQINAGVLVEATTGGVVQIGTAGSTTILGVAHTIALGTDPSGSQTLSYGASVLDESLASPYSANLAVGPGHFNVTYAAAALFGARLKCAANGQVTPWISGTDAANLIIGVCTEPAGVAGGATVARAKIF